MRRGLLPTLAACLWLGGCAVPDSSTTSSEAAGTRTVDAPGGPGETNGDRATTELKPPSPDSVLYIIYQRDGNGAHAYELDSGATVSYWFGHEFELGGKRYFTGFASKTNDRDLPDGDMYKMEDGRVAISQATFMRIDEPDSPAWSQPDTDGYVGEFGRNDRAEEIDTSRQVQSHATADGRMLLAIPTRDFEGGVETRAFALFRFDPDNVDQLPFRSWGYLGSIPAGEDNSAACADGEVMPCVARSGVLSFEAATDAGLPRLRITPSGNTIAAPGDVRALGPQDASTYAFDAKAGSYRP